MKTPALATILAMATLMASSAFAGSETTTTPAAPATGANTSAPHPTKKQCEADAKTKKLTGDQKKQYVKKCQAGTAAD
jgi:hypothetical protein